MKTGRSITNSNLVAQGSHARLQPQPLGSDANHSQRVLARRTLRASTRQSKEQKEHTGIPPRISGVRSAVSGPGSAAHTRAHTHTRVGSKQRATCPRATHELPPCAQTPQVCDAVPLSSPHELIQLILAYNKREEPGKTGAPVVMATP
jgi:ribosome assembly protein YihI (activator of Der GTPase)